jgi:cytidylate kinase
MPILTVSRMFGAGGAQVAAAVAERLRWSLLDDALIDRVAARLGVSRQEVEAREERVPSLAERLAQALALATPELVGPAMSEEAPAVTEERLLEVTRGVIREAAARGPVVIVGRGSQAALAERDDALHVFCCAPRAALVASVALRRGVGEEAAGRLVDETNRQREQYVRRHWGREWRAAENYHLCVNTARLGVEGSVRLVLALARDRFGGPTPAG